MKKIHSLTQTSIPPYGDKSQAWNAWSRHFLFLKFDGKDTHTHGQKYHSTMDNTNPLKDEDYNQQARVSGYIKIYYKE